MNIVYTYVRKYCDDENISVLMWMVCIWMLSKSNAWNRIYKYTTIILASLVGNVRIRICGLLRRCYWSRELVCTCEFYQYYGSWLICKHFEFPPKNEVNMRDKFKMILIHFSNLGLCILSYPGCYCRYRNRVTCETARVRNIWKLSSSSWWHSNSIGIVPSNGKIKFRTFLVSALDGSELSVLRSICFTSEEKKPPFSSDKTYRRPEYSTQGKNPSENRILVVQLINEWTVLVHNSRLYTIANYGNKWYLFLIWFHLITCLKTLRMSTKPPRWDKSGLRCCSRMHEIWSRNSNRFLRCLLYIVKCRFDSMRKFLRDRLESESRIDKIIQHEETERDMLRDNLWTFTMASMLSKSCVKTWLKMA
jgi:hypothetical protein